MLGADAKPCSRSCVYLVCIIKRYPEPDYDSCKVIREEALLSLVEAKKPLSFVSCAKAKILNFGVAH